MDNTDSDAAIRDLKQRILGLSIKLSLAKSELNELHQAVDALPVMTLYIPVAFPEVELAGIAQWARQECAPLLLLDIHIDSQVVGGCAFVWNDRYHDFSFKTQVKKYPGVITQQLSTYV
jgi:F0F1-type ATP synthase delta subunit